MDRYLRYRVVLDHQVLLEKEIGWDDRHLDSEAIEAAQRYWNANKRYEVIAYAEVYKDGWSEGEELLWVSPN